MHLISVYIFCEYIAQISFRMNVNHFRYFERHFRYFEDVVLYIILLLA